jgi:uncharacterized protein (DUF305 family)
LICGVAAVTMLGGVAACTGTPAEPAAPVLVPGKPGEPARTLSPGETLPKTPQAPPSDAEVRFLRDMIVHHQQAIEMARLGPERAAALDVKRIADRIAASQTPEIEAMNTWLRTHGQPTVDPAHAGHESHDGMPGMATPAQLDALRAATGTAFDALFLQLMITHHEGALTMAGEIQLKGKDPRIQEIADEVIAVQSAEINRMRAIRG